MIADGADHFTEIGPGKVLQGLMGKIDKSVATAGVE
jgi:[acyl-carrier-protein] S-malonyltransferase